MFSGNSEGDALELLKKSRNVSSSLLIVGHDQNICVCVQNICVCAYVYSKSRISERVILFPRDRDG